MSRASFLFNMGDILIAKVLQGGEHRVRRCLPEAAQRRGFDLLTQFGEIIKVLHRSFTSRNSFENFEHPLGADTAEGALATGLCLSEGEEELGDIDHAGRFIHNDQPARAHDRTGLGDLLVVDLGIAHRGGNTSARWTAHLDGLESFVVYDAVADSKYDLIDRHPHRDFDQSGSLDLAGHGEDFRAFAVRRAVRRIGLAAIGDYPWYVGVGLDVIDVSRFAP